MAPQSSPPWIAVLSDPAPGSHAIFWSDGSEECDRVTAAFLRGAVHRNDLAMIVLPRKDIESLEWRLARERIDLERLCHEGRALRLFAEDLVLEDAKDVAAVSGFTDKLRDFARSVGRDGISICTKVAPLFFGSGEQRMAETFERDINERIREARVLCLYDARSLPHERMGAAIALTRLHTQSITAMGGSRFLVEEVRRPQLLVA